MPDVPWGPKLDSKQRMQVARLGGAAQLRAAGHLRDQSDEQSLGELLDISRDPLVWGVILGDALADIELGLGVLSERIVGWARQAGADEEAAEVHRRWLVTRPRAMRRAGALAHEDLGAAQADR